VDAPKFILLLLALNLGCFGQRVKTPDMHANSQVRFTQNKHQWDANIAYRAQLDGGALFVEQSGKLTFHFYDKDSYRARHLGKIVSSTLKFHAYSVEFPGAFANPNILSEDVFPDYDNYYIGKEREHWASQVKHYKKISLQNLYPSIDAVYIGKNQAIKYNFIVRPGGDPAEIRMRYTGVDNIRIKDGKLYIGTSVKDMIEEKPFVYQVIGGDTVEIASKFVLKDRTVSFKLLKDYDHTLPLIIDPLLVFAAQSGSTADNFGMTATYDDRGCLYSGGTVFNVGFPTTTGAYDLSFNNVVAPGRTDVVITKYDSAGTFLKYSTYLGGNNAETVSSLIVDKNDNLCLYGTTGSSNFPTTMGCYDATFNGGTYLSFVANGTTFNNGTDIYVAKFNTTGTSLLSSTYIGGSENDGVNHVNHLTFIPAWGASEYYIDSLQYNYGDQYRGEIQTDTSGNIYVLSSSRSADFPTLNAIDNTLGGKQDAVLFKFNSTLSNLYFSTYIGGSNNDCGNSLALDDTLNIYITGGTCGPDFPVTTGSYQQLYGGGIADGFVCKIKKNGASLMHSSYIGTTVYDQSYFVQLDEQQDVYLYGQSLGNMPVTPGVYSNGGSKQFIQKFNPQLSSLLVATVFGNGTSNISIAPSAFSVDCAGNIYISGWGGNILTGNATNGMAITGNAIQSTTDGFNFYLMVLAPNMTSILFGSYFGGPISQEHSDGGTSRFDKSGIMYQSVCAGCGGNDDFPVTPGAWPNTPGNPNHNTNCNNGVFKLDFQLNSAVASILTSTLTGCAPLTVQFDNTSGSGHGFTWDFGNHDTTSLILNPVRTFTAAGTYTASLYVKKSICNNLFDTARVVITVQPVPTASFTAVIDTCSNKVTFINQTNPITVPAYWYINSLPVATTTNYTQSFVSAGSYTAMLIAKTSFGCVDTITQVIIVPVDSVSINAPQTKCAKAVVPLLATGGDTYSWQPATGLSDPSIANPLCNAQSTTIYTLTITQNSLLNKVCIKTLTTSVTVYPVINAAFTYTIGACRNDVTFTDASTISPVSWSWDFGNGAGSSSQNPSYLYSNPALYNVSLIVTNSNGCKDTIVQQVNLAGFDAVTVSSPVSKCMPDTVQLNASGGNYYHWEPPAGLSSTSIKNPKAFPSVTTVYTVTIGNIVGSDTCKTLLTTTVTVYPFAYNTASITVSSTSVNVGQTTTVTLQGFPYTGTLTVTPDIPVRMINNETYVLTPNRTGEYEITFTSQNGCVNRLTTIFVQMITDVCNEGTVYLPTGFTPNGDGANDILYIRSNFITEVYLTIYDRWGEKLFETDDVKKGWDGIYKGKKLDQGVYGYYMTFKCNNGQESFKKGNITLMR
jgi:gliding motility-associated-like protein